MGAAQLPSRTATTRRTLLATLLTPTACAAQPTTLATPFALPPLDHSPFHSLGALELHRSNLGFGAFSGLHLAPDLTLTAVTDTARFAEFNLALDAVLRPQALTLKRAGRLGDGAGRPLPRGYAGDAEALTRLPDGRWLVAFERWHRIRSYRDLAGPGAPYDAPPGLDRAPGNRGLEALTALPDGRILAITEEMPLSDAPGAYAAWIGRPGAWRAIGWRPALGHLATDAAALPDGGALVLERFFSLFGGITARITRIPAALLADPAPGTILQGEELIRLDGALPPENYEGIAVTLHGGRTLVAVISDDNENALQRSLLLLFEFRG
mgnify:CR=1 FL=1